jgi:hypothetical protein
MTASEWNHLIANPMVIPEKKQAPLATWGSMVSRPEIDPPSGYPRCTGANIEELYALSVDVDNGLPMTDFERTFHRYSYQLWTTYSWHNGKEGDRYKVVFPLKEHIKVKWLEGPVKKYLIDFFNMADKTCFDRGHWQVLPCVQSRDKDYRYVQHQGELLSFAHENFEKMWTEYKEDFHWRREIAEADRDLGDNHEGALRHIQTVFDSTTEGSRDTTVYKSIMWLKDTVGSSYNEVISLRPPYGFDTEYMRKVDRLYNMR